MRNRVVLSIARLCWRRIWTAAAGRVPIQRSWVLSGFIFKLEFSMRCDLFKDETSDSCSSNSRCWQCSQIGGEQRRPRRQLVRWCTTEYHRRKSDLWSRVMHGPRRPQLHTAGKAAGPGPLRSLVGHRTIGGRLLIAVQGNIRVEFGHWGMMRARPAPSLWSQTPVKDGVRVCRGQHNHVAELWNLQKSRWRYSPRSTCCILPTLFINHWNICKEWWRWSDYHIIQVWLPGNVAVWAAAVVLCLVQRNW